MTDRTKTDARTTEWSVDDAVVRLRRWASDDTYPLPSDATAGEWIIGSGESAGLRLADTAARVSRAHAGLARDAKNRWIVRDLASKNGTKLDGVRAGEGALVPGLELWLGGVTLVAESARSIALRGFLQRILGWSQLGAVDLALRAIRMAAARRSALVLCSDDDVVSLARAIHRRALGAERPFVVCDPRRKRADGNVRNAENYADGMAAFAAATRGTLCVWSAKLPRDFRDVKAALADPDARVQLVVCARQPGEAEAFGAGPVAIPQLARRTGELERVVFEYAGDAAAELGLPHAAFTKHDRAWVLEHETHALPEIEKATLRLLALRHEGGNISRAAARLGMARMSLHKWIGRRKLPIAAQ